jgi:hypothetical protein
MTILRTRNACWIHKTTNTHLEYVIFIDFPLQQWLHERGHLEDKGIDGRIILKYIFKSWVGEVK